MGGWEANMDLLKRETGLTLYDDDWKIYSVSPVRPAQYIGPTAKVKNSLVVEGCTVHGTVENSVLFEGKQRSDAGKLSPLLL